MVSARCHSPRVQSHVASRTGDSGRKGHGANIACNTTSAGRTSSWPRRLRRRLRSTVRNWSSTIDPRLPSKVTATRVGQGRIMLVKGAMMTVSSTRFIESGETITQGLALLISRPTVGLRATVKTSPRCGRFTRSIPCRRLPASAKLRATGSPICVADGAEKLPPNLRAGDDSA